MQCSKPLFLKNRGLYVPCGSCINCRVAKSREWKQRLLCELQSWSNALFLTFTYNDDNLPKDLSLSKREAQLLIKRLRKSLSKQGRKLKYFLCGEYGDMFLRPHYHAILFGLSWKDKPLLESAWNKGFIYLGFVSGDSIGYCTDYVLKKWRKGDKEYEDDPREPPFHLQSLKFGLKYLEEHYDEIRQKQNVEIGTTSGMPRYFKKKILSKETFKLSDRVQRELTKDEKKAVDLEKQKLFSISIERTRENKRKDYEKFKLYKDNGWFTSSFDDWFKMSNRQKYLNAEGRLRMYKHKGDL